MTKEFILDYEDTACECLPEDHNIVIRINDGYIKVFCMECGEEIDIVQVE